MNSDAYFESLHLDQKEEAKLRDAYSVAAMVEAEEDYSSICPKCGTLPGENSGCSICNHYNEVMEMLSHGPIREASGEDWRSILDDTPKRRIIGDTDDFSLHDHLKEQFPYGHERFIELCIDEMALHSRKNYDYAHGGNPLGNFTRVANILSNYPGLKLTPPVVALVYAMKQLDAVLWQLSQGYEGTVEGIDDKAMDIHVYIKLFRILLEEA